MHNGRPWHQRDERDVAARLAAAFGIQPRQIKLRAAPDARLARGAEVKLVPPTGAAVQPHAPRGEQQLVEWRLTIDLQPQRAAAATAVTACCCCSSSSTTTTTTTTTTTNRLAKALRACARACARRLSSDEHVVVIVQSDREIAFPHRPRLFG